MVEEAAAAAGVEAEEAPEQGLEQEAQALAPGAEQARVAQQELASEHPVMVRGMAARVVSAMAVRYRLRPRGTRCRQRFRIRKPVAGITAHQASLRVDSLSRPESPY